MNRNIKLYCGFTLQDLLLELSRAGVLRDDFDKITFDRDYDDCYYEGDEPGIVAVFSENLIKK